MIRQRLRRACESIIATRADADGDWQPHHWTTFELAVDVLVEELGRESVKPKAARLKADPPALTAAKAEVRKRSDGKCERCIYTRGVHVHHILRRSQGGKHDPENLVNLCEHCHNVIHAHPDWAKRHGWLRSPGGPLIEPVRGCTAACDVDHRPVAS